MLTSTASPIVSLEQPYCVKTVREGSWEEKWMAISKYNSEGYHDPTTYEALKTVEKEITVTVT